MPGLLIISVYRPDLHDDALRSIGVAPDLLIVRDRRIGERRQQPRTPDAGGMRVDRRRIDIDDQLRTSGWAFVSPKEREAVRAAIASQRPVTSARGN